MRLEDVLFLFMLKMSNDELNTARKPISTHIFLGVPGDSGICGHH